MGLKWAEVRSGGGSSGSEVVDEVVRVPELLGDKHAPVALNVTHLSSSEFLPKGL